MALTPLLHAAPRSPICSVTLLSRALRRWRRAHQLEADWQCKLGASRQFATLSAFRTWRKVVAQPLRAGQKHCLTPPCGAHKKAWGRAADAPSDTSVEEAYKQACAQAEAHRVERADRARRLQEFLDQSPPRESPPPRSSLTRSRSWPKPSGRSSIASAPELVPARLSGEEQVNRAAKWDEYNLRQLHVLREQKVPAVAAVIDKLQGLLSDWPTSMKASVTLLPAVTLNLFLLATQFYANFWRGESSNIYDVDMVLLAFGAVERWSRWAVAEFEAFNDLPALKPQGTWFKSLSGRTCALDLWGSYHVKGNERQLSYDYSNFKNCFTLHAIALALEHAGFGCKGGGPGFELVSNFWDNTAVPHEAMIDSRNAPDPLDPWLPNRLLRDVRDGQRELPRQRDHYPPKIYEALMSLQAWHTYDVALRHLQGMQSLRTWFFGFPAQMVGARWLAVVPQNAIRAVIEACGGVTSRFDPTSSLEMVTARSAHVSLVRTESAFGPEMDRALEQCLAGGINSFDGQVVRPSIFFTNFSTSDAALSLRSTIAQRASQQQRVVQEFAQLPPRMRADVRCEECKLVQTVDFRLIPYPSNESSWSPLLVAQFPSSASLLSHGEAPCVRCGGGFRLQQALTTLFPGASEVTGIPGGIRPVRAGHFGGRKGRKPFVMQRIRWHNFDVPSAFQEERLQQRSLQSFF